MVRMLQTVSVLALISAGIILVLCADQWLHDGPEIEQYQQPSITEKFKQAGSSSRKSSEKTISPLVKQAEAFALYLNPPEPPKPERVKDTATSNSKQNTLVVQLPETTPQFTLLATSYYRARPAESLALVSEPGREPRWVEQGTHIGHFIVEKIEPRMIVYREGDRLGEMAIDTKVPIRPEPTTQMTLASDETGTARPKSSGPDEPKKTRPRSPMHKLGPPRPERQVVAYDQSIASG